MQVHLQDPRRHPPGAEHPDPGAAAEHRAAAGEPGDPCRPRPGHASAEPEGASGRTGGFDLVARVSQWSLDAEFHRLFGRGYVSRAIDEEEGGSSLRARLDAPTVLLRTEGLLPSSAPRIHLVLHLRSGTLAVGSTRLEIDRWVAAFRVDMGTELTDRDTLARHPRIPDETKAVLQALDPALKIIRLYLRLVAGSLDQHIDRALSSLPPLEPDVYLRFTALLHRFLRREMGPENPLNVGYIPVMEGAGARPAAPEEGLLDLRPTAVRYSVTYQRYQPPCSTFNFLMMTGNRPPPRTPGPVTWSKPATRFLVSHRLLLERQVFAAVYRSFPGHGTFVHDPRVGWRRAWPWSDSGEHRYPDDHGSTLTLQVARREASEVVVTAFSDRREPYGDHARIEVRGSHSRTIDWHIPADGQRGTLKGRLEWGVALVFTVSDGVLRIRHEHRPPHPEMEPRTALWFRSVEQSGSSGIRAAAADMKAWLVGDPGDLLRELAGRLSLFQQLVLPARKAFFFASPTFLPDGEEGDHLALEITFDAGRGG